MPPTNLCYIHHLHLKRYYLSWNWLQRPKVKFFKPNVSILCVCDSVYHRYVQCTKGLHPWQMLRYAFRNISMGYVFVRVRTAEKGDLSHKQHTQPIS
jgi:hypothetical protein